MATRSLGTLTLDLVAKTSGFIQGMDKSARESAKWKKKVKKELEEVANVAKIAGAAAIAGITALTVQTVRAAEEISKLSAVSGTSTDDFQRYAAGANLLGIEQEKLGDIFKDTRDKVGDFLATGAGPLVDFFDNVGKQAGVTAEQFKGLSGPEALGLYVKTLEDANVSQNEMVFYLEAIASDATLLLPLLRNGSEGFKLLGDEAEKAGAILDQKTIKSTQQLNAAMFLFEQSSKGASNIIAQELLPTLSDLAVDFADVSAEGELFKKVGEGIETALKGVLTTVTGAAAAFDLLGSALGGAAFVISQIPKGFDAVAKAYDEVTSDLDDIANKYANAIDKILTAGEREPTNGGVNKTVQTIATLLNDANEQATKLSSTPIKLSLDVVEDDGSEQRKQDAINRQAERIAESLLSEEEQIKASYARRAEIINQSTIENEEGRKRLLEKLAQQRNDELAALEEARQEAILASSQELFGNLAGLAKQFAGENSKTFKALFAVEKAIGIARSIVAIQTGLAEASANPWPANLAAIAQVASATANIVSTIQGTQVQGVAHDGLDRVPKTGTYLLEQGERVTTERTSAKLDRKLDRIDSGAASKQQNLRINNIIDPKFVGDYMSGDEGDRVIDNWVNRNQSKLQQIAGGGR